MRTSAALASVVAFVATMADAIHTWHNGKDDYDDEGEDLRIAKLEEEKAKLEEEKRWLA